MANEPTSTSPSDGSSIWSHYPMYAATVRDAAGTNDVGKMREVADRAEAWLRESGDVGAALEDLKAEIAKRDTKAS